MSNLVEPSLGESPAQASRADVRPQVPHHVGKPFRVTVRLQAVTQRQHGSPGHVRESLALLNQYQYVG